MAVDFLRLLLTQRTRDRADFELEKVENRQIFTKMYTKSGKIPGILVFSLKDLIFIIQKLEVIKFIHFGGGGEIRVLKQKLQNLRHDTFCLSFSCNFIG